MKTEKTENRSRNIQLKFHVDEHERKVIYRRMELAKTNKKEAFLRKQAMDGAIINIDYSHLNELFNDVGKATSNINQIAKRVNSTGRIYLEDFEEIKLNQNQIISALRAMDSKLL